MLILGMRNDKGIIWFQIELSQTKMEDINVNEQKYIKEFDIKWSDLDPNRHLRHSVYSDYATQVRISFLAENGFPFAKFQELQIGPVLMKEEIVFFREVGMENDFINIDIQLAGLAPNGAKWKLRHNIVRADGLIAASILAEGCWLDLKLRLPAIPPKDLYEALLTVPKSHDYDENCFKRKKQNA